MRTLSLGICLMIAGAGALAFADKGPKENDCDAFKLSPDQETQMKAMSYEFGDKRVDLESAVKHARLNYERVLAKDTSDAKAIKDAAATLAERSAALMTAEELFHAELYGKVLKPAQRALVFQCAPGPGFGPGMMGEGHPPLGPEHHGRPGPGGPRGPHPKPKDEPPK